MLHVFASPRCAPRSLPERRSAITLAEHPARMELEPRLAALPSVPSSKRAAWMHVPLALLCFLDGVVA